MKPNSRWYGFLAAFLLAALSLPAAAAPTKQYSLSIGLVSATYDTVNGQNTLQGPVTISVTVKNESPPSTANSNISSFKFTLYGQNISKIATCPNAICSVDPSDPNHTVIVTNISPPIQAGPGYTLNLITSSCGDVTAPTGTTFVYTGSQLTGTQFSVKNQPNTLTVSCGDFACTGSDIFFTVPDSTNPAPGSANFVTGLRGQFDKNGACADVSYDVTNTIPTDNRLHFAWDLAADSAAVFAYQVNVGNDGSGPIQVSWLNNPDGTPSFIPALQCQPVSVNPPDDLPLPAPYGFLASAVKANDKSIKVDTSGGSIPVPNPFPALGFPIVVESERMQVTKINNGTWTVSRNAGVPHVAGLSVMSTPLPLLTQTQGPYIAGKPAQVCIAYQAQPVNGVTSAWIIDIGDSWTLGR